MRGWRDGALSSGVGRLVFSIVTDAHECPARGILNDDGYDIAVGPAEHR